MGDSKVRQSMEQIASAITDAQLSTLVKIQTGGWMVPDAGFKQEPLRARGEVKPSLLLMKGELLRRGDGCQPKGYSGAEILSKLLSSSSGVKAPPAAAAAPPARKDSADPGKASKTAWRNKDWYVLDLPLLLLLVLRCAYVLALALALALLVLVLVLFFF